MYTEVTVVGCPQHACTYSQRTPSLRGLQEGLALTGADPFALLDGGGKPGGSAVPIEAAEGPGAVTVWFPDETLPPEAPL